MQPLFGEPVQDAVANPHNLPQLPVAYLCLPAGPNDPRVVIRPTRQTCPPDRLVDQ